MRMLFKGIVQTLAWITISCVALPAHADYTIERLSLFIYDGANVYEDRRLTSPVSNLPAGVTVYFDEDIDAHQNRTWTWTFQNTNAVALNNLRVTGFLDVDLSAPANTFHNEYGELLALSAPAGYLAADRWEIGEPGYLTGDLLPRASQGNLQNQSTLNATNPDDAAMALSLSPGTLEPDQTLAITATLTATGTVGLRQIDADDSSQVVFQLYGQKDVTAHPSTTSDYHVALTSSTPSVNVGDAVAYTITIGNNGADDGEGVSLTVAIPAAMGNVAWNCVGANSASCGTANGSGNTINLTALVPTTGTITVDITGTAVTSGVHTGTATVTPRGNTTDPTAANNSSNVDITVSGIVRAINADLGVNITTSTPTANVRDTVNYQIVAINNGTEDGDNITLAATIPNAINNVTWTCAASGNAACNTANGSGNTIALTVDLPVGETVTLDINGVANTAGSHSATAAIDPLSEITDPDRSNNSSSVDVVVSGVTPANTTQPIPSSSFGTLVLLSLLLAGVAALRVKSMRKALLPALLFAAFLSSAVVSHEAKAIFENGRFEAGTFEHWQEQRGTNHSGLSGTPPFTGDDIRINAAYSMRLLEIVGRVFDPRAQHLQLPREGNFTAKVNDEFSDLHINAISQKGVITEADRDPIDGKLYVRFTYAAVLEDPNHNPEGQPYFHVLLKDVTSDKVLYDDFAYSNQPGRMFYATIYEGSFWRSTPFIDVEMEVPDSSLGHEIEVRVLAADCAHGDHAGYVYVDAFGSQALPPQGSCLAGLKARGKPGAVQLTWPDNGAAKYAVYRATQIEGPHIPLGVTESRYSSWLDETVDNGTVYYYSVRPMDADGNEMCTSGEIIGVAPEEWKPGDPLSRPPVFVSDLVTIGDVRAPYSYTPEVRDADGDTLTFSLLYGPMGMTVDQATGKLDWQPTDIGSYRVNLKVEDSDGNVSNQAFAIDVTDGNRPPVINNPMPEQIPSGAAFRHDLQATDPDGDEVIYAIGSQADGLLPTSDGRLTWIWPIAGRYPVTVIVYDIHGAMTRQQLVLQVMGSPKFVSTPVIRANVNVPYIYQAQAEDGDSPVLKYSLLEAPTGMTINENTGLIEWTATSTGNYNVTVQAEDPEGNTGQQKYTVQMTTIPNRPPVFTGVPVTYVAYPGIYSYHATATDPDGDRLLWTLKQGPKGMGMVSNTASLISWKPSLYVEGVFTVEVEVSDQRGGIATQIFDVRVPSSNNKPPRIYSSPANQVLAGQIYSYNVSAFDEDGDSMTLHLITGPASMQFDGGLLTWETTVADIGLHHIEIEARDSRGGWSTQTWILEVVPATANRMPSINSTPSATGTAGTTYTYQISASDPDGDPLTYKFVVAPNGMTISATGRIEWPIPASTVDVFDVEIEVADNKGAYVRQSYSIGVGETGNRPPYITGAPGASATVGSLYTYQANASDSDSDPLTYTLADKPDGMVLSATNRIEWTPTAAQNGFHVVVLTVSDGRGGSVTQTWAIYAQLANNYPPHISSAPVSRAKPGASYQHNIVASDPNGDPLTYSLSEAPDGMTISAQGEINWPSPVEGNHPVTVRVTDPYDAYVTQSYILQVTNENLPPIITSTPITSVAVNSPYSYQVVATDPDGDFLTYQLVAWASGMTISSTSGLIEWVAPAYTGSHTVTVRVSDGQLTQDQTYTLVVQEVSGVNLFLSANWIQSQQRTDGSYATNYDFAMPEIATSEGLTAFRTLGLTINASQDWAYNYQSIFDTASTERLARKIIAAAEKGSVDSATTTTLKSYQNEDGGFGSYQGYASHPLETAWALKALEAAGEPTDTPAQRALSWLNGQQQSAGNWHSNVDSDDLVLTAQVMEAIHIYSVYFNVQNQLTSGAQWIMNQQASGQWGSPLKNAWALRAVLPSLTTLDSVQTAVDALVVAQQANGSWNNEVYLTAIALHALVLAEQK